MPATLTQSGSGNYALSGELNFATVTALLAQSRTMFADATTEVDLAGVTHADSAGLALLVEWLRQARQLGKSLRYHAMPTQLLALASISEVEELLSPA